MKKNSDALTPQTEREKLTLAVLTGAQPNSRLSCQAKIVDEGVQVELPDGLYVESFSELEALVGTRTPVPILHPVSGETLIQADKLVVRTLIMRLRDVDFSTL